MLRALTFCLLMAIPAAAEESYECADYTFVTERLKERHGENLSGTTLSKDGAHIEVWENWVSGSFTILLVTDGLACLVNYGYYFDPELDLGI